MRVLLADDHPLFLEGLRNVLAGRGVNVVGTANDGLQAIELTRALRPDVVLMDIRMPRCNGLDATRLIKAEMPEVKIVILTMSEDDEDLFDAIKSGASGYLPKSLTAEEFMGLVIGVLEGEPAIPRRLAARIINEFAQPEPRSREQAAHNSSTPASDRTLTRRQIEVLQMVAQGYTYKEIAAALNITERTVEYHMGEILNRLHLQNRAQVIAYATRAGWIAPDSTNGV
ncbi:MAG: response regulator transcription factor [Anaerolineae bacterium]|nr:response regulator transcription factor [Thermoflexales bacterium]MDW8408918.1 response regulator transcription factor [Anaerolineae bacterium]